MGKQNKYTPFFVSAVLLVGVLCVIYPHYQYYVDPDGTAYLTIARRYAEGDISRAINGYWSPWACWLTAGLMKAGLRVIPAGVVVNTIGGIGFLFISQSFFLRFDVGRKLQWLLNVTLALFLCYAVFWQSFDDLWECFFLLSTLRLMLCDGFVRRPALWVLCGVIGTLAYFAKAYSFPFFILNTLVCVYVLSKDDKRRWLLISFVSVAVMLVCSVPWIWALHNKYGIWTTSTAGSLNMSWYLWGHPIWKDGIGALLPPPYPDSPYYWEDPWFVNGATPHFWDSWHLFGLQFLRMGLNVWKFIVSSFQLSVFFIAIVAYAKWRLFWKRGRGLAVDEILLLLSPLLFATGYLLINYESRYLWYMVPLSMVAGAMFLQRTANMKWRNILAVVFAVSFLVWPVVKMVDMYDEGKREYEYASGLRTHNFKGTFASMASAGVETQSMVRIAYFSGCSFYAIPSTRISKQEFIREMRRYHIKYYVGGVCYGSSMYADPLTDENNKPFLYRDGVYLIDH